MHATHIALQAGAGSQSAPAQLRVGDNRPRIHNLLSTGLPALRTQTHKVAI
jgi:hypothetical protein